MSIEAYNLYNKYVHINGKWELINGEGGEIDPSQLEKFYSIDDQVSTSISDEDYIPVSTSTKAKKKITLSTIINKIKSFIPTESTVAGWGFTKNKGDYTKPEDGIPKTDLALDVQTSLGKADTALQSYTETDPTVQSWAKINSGINVETSVPSDAVFTDTHGVLNDIYDSERKNLTLSIL